MLLFLAKEFITYWFKKMQLCNFSTVYLDAIY